MCIIFFFIRRPEKYTNNDQFMIGFDGLFINANNGTLGNCQDATFFTQNSSNILSPSPLKSWVNTTTPVRFNPQGTMELINDVNPNIIIVDTSLTPYILSLGAGSNINSTFKKIYLSEYEIGACEYATRYCEEDHEIPKIKCIPLVRNFVLQHWNKQKLDSNLDQFPDPIPNNEQNLDQLDQLNKFFNEHKHLYNTVYLPILNTYNTNVSNVTDKNNAINKLRAQQKILYNKYILHK